MGNYDELKKAELQDAARSRSLDDSGTVEELRARLELDDTETEADRQTAVARGDDGLGNTRPGDRRFLEGEGPGVDDRSDQVPVAPGSAATMKPVLDADGELYPSAAQDLDNADEVKARLEAAGAEQEPK